ncbi:MAG TPA: hypothetical protein VM869_21450 [Enhygromyxa sp.]|nr:hypothetical protein [Enhygromyxa sp.]
MDVSATHFGRAYELAPSPERLEAWSDAKARASAWRTEIDDFDDSADPLELARLGDSLWRAGEHVKARRAWSAARVELDQRGASMRLVAVERGPIEHLAWHGDELLVARHWTSHDGDHPVVATELRRFITGAEPQLLGSMLLPEPTRSMSISSDGQQLIRLSRDPHSWNDGVFVHELASGRTLAHFDLMPPYNSKPRVIAAAVTPSLEHVLFAVPEAVELRTRTGEQLERFELEPTWRTASTFALAVSDDARYVAFGGPDSRVQLFDRERGRMHDLQFHSRRRDLEDEGLKGPNHPLAMRFVDAGHSLLVSYHHGDVIRWRSKDGKLMRRFAGACKPGELARLDVDEPAPLCGVANTSQFSPDASLLVTGGLSHLRWDSLGMRVRRLDDGHTLGLLLDRALPSELLAIDSDGRVALGDRNGQLRTWSAAEGLSAAWLDAVEVGAIGDPELSADARFLQFRQGSKQVRWDLLDAAPLEAHPMHDGYTSADGSRWVVVGNDGIVVDERPGSRRIASIDGPIEDAALAPDGSWVVWIERGYIMSMEPRHGSSVPATFVYTLELDGDGAEPEKRLVVTGMPHRVLMVDDGHVLIATDYSLVHWWPGSDETEKIQLPPTLRGELQRCSDDGRTLYFADDQHIELRANTRELTLLGVLRVHADGWLLHTPSGVVDGSESAWEHMLTLVVEPSGEVLVHPGTLAWDRFAVDDLISQMP